MKRLAANPGPFFMRIDPNAAVFTPHFNKIRDCNFGLFYSHQDLLVSFGTPGREHDMFQKSVHRTTTFILSIVCMLAQLLATEMKRVSQVLQFAIVIQRSWPPPILETQVLEKLNFFRRRISV